MPIATSSSRLAGFFLSRSILTEAEWENMSAVAAEQQKNVLNVLLAAKKVTTAQAHEAMAYERGWRYEDLSATGEIPDEIIDLVTPELARQHKFVPIRIEQGKLYVATANPNDIAAERVVAQKSGYDVELVYSPSPDVERAVGHYYSLQAEARKNGERATASLASEVAREAMTVTRDVGNIVDVLDSILEAAIVAGASDIHLEPEENRLRIRYSIDGVPRDFGEQSLAVGPRVLSLIKTRAGLDSADLRNQDGVLDHYFQNKNYNLRVAVLPTYFGQSITLRVGQDEVIPLDRIGYSPLNAKLYREILRSPSGGIIHTGPMGSGKTLGLMAAVDEYIKQGHKIVSLEDPVEVRMPSGITQVSINRASDMDWEQVMPTVLRFAAKVLLLGEINRKEIAHVAIEAALTGHLLLSTLHTIDAPGAIIRLREMGLQPSVLADALRGVVAQRLPRKLCSCKVRVKPTEQNIRDFRLTPAIIQGTEWWGANPSGCERCSGIGFKGRMPIHEILTFPTEIRDMVSDNESTRAIAQKARELGMTSLRDDGLYRVREGLTSLDEVRSHIIID